MVGRSVWRVPAAPPQARHRRYRRATPSPDPGRGDGSSGPAVVAGPQAVSSTTRLAPISDKRHRTNESIRVPQVRLIDAEGNQAGIVATDEALRMARAQGLDLVEVAPMASPPVCRLMDYGKYVYRLAKDRKQKAHQPQLKEVKFRPKIDEHDYAFKLKHIQRFLEQGHMVKATIMFRGREVVHPELGRQILERVQADLGDGFRVESSPQMQGRQMSMVLTPKRD